MATNVTATFAVTGWDERPLDEVVGAAKWTQSSATKSFDGDVDGTAALEYLMVYAADGSATFVGLERFQGRVAGRSGTFVLQHVGRFEDGAAKGHLTVAAGSGTGDLTGLSGGGTFVADPSGSMDLSVTFD